MEMRRENVISKEKSRRCLVRLLLLESMQRNDGKIDFYRHNP